MEWNEGNTAPKDGKPFIGVIKGYPFAVLCCFSGAEKKFVHTTLQASSFKGQVNDMYFENEYVTPSAIVKWQLLPEA